MIDWTTLTDTIIQGKCILFLGPQATVNYTIKNKEVNYFKELLIKYPDDLHDYHSQDNLFLFKRLQAEYEIQNKLRMFYDGNFSSPMLTMLSQIPFHLIISLSPDRSLQKMMETQGFSYREDFYETDRTRQIDPPSTKLPLVYHLLGQSSGLTTDTIIVSHGHMYKYIRAFIGGTKLPDSINTAFNIKNAKYLVFLGVDFEKWYFQLMLNELGVDANNYNCFAYIQSGSSNFQTIWEKHFRINFIPHQIDEFVAQLHEIFRNKGLLRRAEVITKPRVYKTQNFLNYFEKAFDGPELMRFCFIYFKKVFDSFTTGQTKLQQVLELLKIVDQDGEYPKLLKLMEESNPYQFEKNSPYYEQ